MRYIEAPNEYTGSGPAVFLAGGITDTENWQSRLIGWLTSVDATVLNPRREKFPLGNQDEGRRQIQWEYRHLLRADLIAFWFPKQTVCPIALFELGACCAADAAIVVGTDPDYQRRFDVECQLALRRPGVVVVSSLESLSEEIVRHPMMQGAFR